MAYETRRAADLLSDLESVKIGEPESEALAISQQYDGHRWTVQDKRDFNGADYVYALEINPWHCSSLFGRIRRFDRTASVLRNGISPKWERRLGFRKWVVSGGFAISNGRVVGVSGLVVVEGTHDWLEGGWNLDPEIPEIQRRPQMGNFVVAPAHLLWDDEGRALNTFITPDTSLSDASDARELNLLCLAPTPGCSELSDLMPGATKRYRAKY
jgi:hypothetical protein